ncbi:hypothetical protein EVAR_56013_1 [Eumeta japonica]|uniref:Uncharacterized protein n=1 Tax=Eumeta variegata TaxID=151549 RepID=A0A4C1YZA8_EUMVA|nr:hypothetical protein EVAR_56013_1 [Eumeta japonica]
MSIKDVRINNELRTLVFRCRSCARRGVRPDLVCFPFVCRFVGLLVCGAGRGAWTATFLTARPSAPAPAQSRARLSRAGPGSGAQPESESTRVDAEFGIKDVMAIAIESGTGIQSATRIGIHSVRRRVRNQGRDGNRYRERDRDPERNQNRNPLSARTPVAALRTHRLPVGGTTALRDLRLKWIDKIFLYLYEYPINAVFVENPRRFVEKRVSLVQIVALTNGKIMGMSHAVINFNCCSTQLARQLQYQTLTEYGREVTVSAVLFRPLIEISGGPLPFHHPQPPYIDPLLSLSAQSSIRYPIPTQEAGNAPVIPELRVSMGSGSHLYFGGAHACLPLDNAIKKSIDPFANKLHGTTS